MTSRAKRPAANLPPPSSRTSVPKVRPSKTGKARSTATRKSVEEKNDTSLQKVPINDSTGAAQGELLMKGAFNHIETPILVIDPKSRILMANLAFEKKSGYSGDELKEKLFCDMFLAPEESKRFISYLYSLATDNEKLELEGVIITRDNGELKTLWSFSPVFTWEGHLTYLVVSGTDISAPLQFDRSTRNQGKTIENFFEASQDVYYRTNMEGLITDISPSVGNYGFDARKLIGSPVTDFYVDPAQHDTLRKKLESMDFVKDYEVQFNGRRGRIIHASLSAHLVRDKKGKPETIEGVLRDITERKIQEERAEEERDEYLILIAHDLKSPLSTIMSYSQMLSRSVEGKIPDDAYAYLGLIQQSGDIMFNLINNIVGASRIRSGKMSFVFKTFSLADLLDHLYETFTPLSRLKKVTLNFTCPREIRVNADSSKIRQIFFNLIINAFHYTPENGSISISASQEGEKVFIQVRDTGKGIPESEQKIIFEKFTQTRGESRGTGLGLYIIKKLLEGHRSQIQLESEEGKGTTFSFFLDAAPSGQDESEMQHNVLVVGEGEEFSKDSSVFATRGFKVVTVPGCMEGLQKAQILKPDVILIYCDLPDLPPDQFTYSLKLNPATREIPVLLMREPAYNAKNGGFTSVIQLPARAEEIVEEIRRYLHC